jgi:hypothetical protein
MSEFTPKIAPERAYSSQSSDTRFHQESIRKMFVAIRERVEQARAIPIRVPRRMASAAIGRSNWRGQAGTYTGGRKKRSTHYIGTVGTACEFKWN